MQIFSILPFLAEKFIQILKTVIAISNPKAKYANHVSSLVRCVWVECEHD